jgi:hypothetical protein
MPSVILERTYEIARSGNRAGLTEAQASPREQAAAARKATAAKLGGAKLGKPVIEAKN